MLVARFDPTSGEVDLGFGDRGVTVVDFGAHEFASNAYSANLTQQADRKLLIVGAQVDEYDWYPWYSIALARVDPYGSGSNGVVSGYGQTPGAPHGRPAGTVYRHHTAPPGATKGTDVQQHQG